MMYMDYIMESHQNASKRIKYNRSKIYKLVDNEDYYYIGSTINGLSQRLRDHKSLAKKYTEQRVYKHFNTCGWDQVRIVLISEHCLDNREQLLQVEDTIIREHKDDPKCLNTHRVLLSNEDKIEYRQKQYNKYYKENKESIINKVKEWNDNNKEHRLQYKKEWYEKNREIRNLKSREYYQKNKEELNRRRREKHCSVKTVSGEIIE